MNATSVHGFADGAARGNPGPASYGIVLKDSQGKLLYEGGEAIGVATNNVAEYSGLKALLKKAIDLQIRSLEVHLDSELIVKQLRGEYKVKHPGLLAFYEDIQKLKTKFTHFAITHIPRKQNAEADAWANKALDKALQ